MFLDTHNANVVFQRDLPHYNTQDGYHQHTDNSITSPCLMWLDALDMLFENLSLTVQLSSVTAIAVSGQQHGSVYWKLGGEEALAAINSQCGGLSVQLSSR